MGKIVGIGLVAVVVGCIGCGGGEPAQALTAAQGNACRSSATGVALACADAAKGGDWYAFRDPETGETFDCLPQDAPQTRFCTVGEGCAIYHTDGSYEPGVCAVAP